MYAKSAAYYDAIYDYKNYADEADAIIRLIRSQLASTPVRMLDVACGTGRHLNIFRQQFDAEGLDINADLIEIARTRNPGCNVYRGNMMNFRLHDRYDAITCMFSSIAYMRTTPQLNQAISVMGRHLKPGGVLLIEPWFSPESFTGGWTRSIYIDTPDLKIARMSISDTQFGMSILKQHFLVSTPSHIDTFEERHVMGLFTDAQYRTAFESAGLRVMRVDSAQWTRGLYVATHDRESQVGERPAHIPAVPELIALTV
jgi:SAM-dependent methyltransferase